MTSEQVDILCDYVSGKELHTGDVILIGMQPHEVLTRHPYSNDPYTRNVSFLVRCQKTDKLRNYVVPMEFRTTPRLL